MTGKVKRALNACRAKAAVSARVSSALNLAVCAASLAILAAMLPKAEGLTLAVTGVAVATCTVGIASTTFVLLHTLTDDE